MSPALRRRMVITTLAAAILLTGCTPTVLAPEVSASREASIRGTNLCIFNNTTMNVRVTWRGDTNAQAVPPAGELCKKGHATSVEDDVLGKLEYEPTIYPGTWMGLVVMATNYSIGKPAAVVEYAAIGGAYGICQSFDEGQSAWMQASWLRADMKRNKDSSDNKEFVLTLTDSQAPIVAQTCVPRYFDDWTN